MNTARPVQQSGESDTSAGRGRLPDPGPSTRAGTWLRRTKWLILLGWILAAVAATPLADKVGDITHDDAATFLPSGVESTEVARLVEGSQPADRSAALVVYAAQDGTVPLTDHARDSIASQMQALRQAMDERDIEGPRVSDDGAAAMVLVPGLTEQAAEKAVPRIRSLVSSPAPGIHVYVSGEAALQVDNSAGDIDTVLLLTSMLIVALLLILSYRSLVLWLLPLFAALAAVQVARGTVYLLGDSGVTVTDLSPPILIVLVFGAATDYALLLLNRYREELTRNEDHHDAVVTAVRRTAPALLASAGTVVAGLLCLLVASLAGLRGLGPILAIGVVVALGAMLTAFPALLAVLGRPVFWPRIPGPAHPERAGTHRWWRGVGQTVTAHPRVVSTVVAVLLGAAALQVGGVTVSADPMDKVPPGSESVEGYTVAQRHFAEDLRAPVRIVLPPGATSADVRAEFAAVEQVTGVGAVSRGDSLARDRPTLQAHLEVPAYGDEAARVIDNLRDVAGAHVLVGGAPAVQLDFKEAALEDTVLIAPLLLLVVCLVIGLLLRSIVAALLVLGTVMLNLLASFGLSLLVYEHVMGYGPVAANLFVYILVFLVALGVDYNIFLADRIREERRRYSTSESVRRGMTYTGGVITAAGLVLAGTFLTLAQLPDVTVAQVGIAVGIGVLLDALVVRTLLFPALVALLDDRTWWPSHPSSPRD